MFRLVHFVTLAPTTHVSGEFARKLGHLKLSRWSRSKLFAVDGHKVTPQHQFNNVEISHDKLNFTAIYDIGIIREQSCDLLIGMDLMNQVGLVIVTPLSTFMLVSDLEKLFRQIGRNILEVENFNWSNSQNEINCNEMESRRANLINLQRMNAETFDKEAEQWTFQPAENIKSVIQDVKSVNDIHNDNNLESVSKAILKTRCYSESSEYFKPKETKLIKVRIETPVLDPSSLNLDEKYEKNGWQLIDAVLPLNTKYFWVYVKNKLSFPRTLTSNFSFAYIEEVDESLCIDIDQRFASESMSEPQMNQESKASETSADKLTILQIRDFDEDIWNGINSYPQAAERLLGHEEQHLSANDTYFDEHINDKYLKNFDISSDLSPRHRYLMQRYLEGNEDIYAFKGDQLGKINCWKHRIPTGDNGPIKQNPYLFSEIQKKEVEKQVNEMLRLGIIVPAVTGLASPITLAPKRDGTWRFCIDYRRLNDITRNDSFPVPRLDEALSVIRGCDRFSVQDAQSCFWQKRLHPDDQEKTTFVCHLGTLMFRVMPFGLTGAPASWMRAMTRIFKDLERRVGFIYMNDLICFSKGVEEHIRRLLILAERCRIHGLKMRADKCTFVYPSVAYLGHRISDEGITPDLERHIDILEKPKPNTVKELQSFLGFANFFRNFIVKFAEKAYPLSKLLRKEEVWRWSEEQEKA